MSDQSASHSPRTPAPAETPETTTDWRALYKDMSERCADAEAIADHLRRALVKLGLASDATPAQAVEFVESLAIETQPAPAETRELLRDVALLFDQWRADGRPFDDYAAQLRERIARWNIAAEVTENTADVTQRNNAPAIEALRAAFVDGWWEHRRVQNFVTVAGADLKYAELRFPSVAPTGIAADPDATARAEAPDDSDLWVGTLPATHVHDLLLRVATSHPSLSNAEVECLEHIAKNVIPALRFAHVAPDATASARLSDHDAMLLVEIADAYRIASHWDAGAKAKRQLLLRLAIGEIPPSPSIAATPDAPSDPTASEDRR